MLFYCLKLSCQEIMMLKHSITLERTARRGWQASHLQVKILLNMTCANWLSRQVGWEKRKGTLQNPMESIRNSSVGDLHRKPTCVSSKSQTTADVMLLQYVGLLFLKCNSCSLYSCHFLCHLKHWEMLLT